jgi:hypothetical protein
VTLASEVLEEVLRRIKHERLESHAIPEGLPILKSFQYIVQYREHIMKILSQVWRRPRQSPARSAAPQSAPRTIQATCCAAAAPVLHVCTA